MITSQWSGMKPRPRKATARIGSPARTATVWWEMFILIAGVTTGRPSLEGVHGKNHTFSLIIYRVHLSKGSSKNCIIFSSTGTLLALPTNLPQSMSGLARTQPLGCFAAATTLGWFATTARSWPLSLHPTCDVSGSCWITMPDTWPSTMPWVPSTFTRSMSLLSSLFVPCSMYGISVWLFLLVCPSQTI